MDWLPAPLVGGAYKDNVRSASVQDTVNWIPERIERPGGRTEWMLRDAPGARVLCDLGTNAPIRGLHNCEGTLFAVSGTTMFRVGATGIATPLGTIPGVSRVSIDHNQITDGNEVLIANGSSGYVFNTVTGVLAQITDTSYPGAVVVTYLNQVLVQIAPNRANWFHSDVTQAMQYLSTDSYEAEAAPDLLVTLIASHGQLIVFGDRTAEFYENVDGGSSFFERMQGTTLEVGCAATHAIARLDATVYWGGSDGCGYRLNGLSPERITTHAIEQAWAQCDRKKMFCFTFEDLGHKIVYFSFPDGYTWGYDVATQEWHRRQSQGLNRWRMNALAYWNKQWIAGDYANGKLYVLDWNYKLEGCEELVRDRISGVLHNNQNKIGLNAIELVFETGGPASLIHGGATITGNLPNQSLGATVNYRYSIHKSYPGHSVSAVISAGALPTGLSMDTAGHVTGTTTESGAFGWTVSAIDECGNRFDLDDSATVGTLTWMVAGNTANDTMNFVLTDDPTDWAATPALLPAAVNNCYTIGSGNGQLVVTYINNADVSSNSGATWASATGLRNESIVGAVFVGSHWVLPTNNGWVNRSTDGLAYTPLAVAGFSPNCVTTIGNRIVGAGPWGFVSDDEGATWTKGGLIGDAFFAAHGIASDGMKAIAVGSQNKLFSTLDGLIWTEIASPFTGTSEIRCIAHDAIGGNWVMVNAVGEIAYATDGGLTFVLVEDFNLGGLPTQGGVAGYQGSFVAVSVDGGGIAASTDGGVTWALCAESFTVPSAVSIVAV
jgi:hypothetical protein